MRNMLHPVSEPDALITNQLSDKTYFITAYGRNHGMLPIRTEEWLRFNHEHGVFSMSIHEYNACIDTGTFECEDIIECINFKRATSFDKFVDRFHTLRRDAQLSGDELDAELYKFVGNSAYGKFAQNPDNYYDYLITDTSADKHSEGWRSCGSNMLTGHLMWKRDTQSTNRLNVATAASITGGARANLIRALVHAKRPLYCDTDSIICEGLDVEIDATKIGAWKIDKATSGGGDCSLSARASIRNNNEKNSAIGDMMAIAGRKMYALYDGKQCVKFACKGAVLTPAQVVYVARGATVKWEKQSPTFDFKTGTMRYLHRNIKRTV
jgi:hypothetical protein